MTYMDSQILMHKKSFIFCRCLLDPTWSHNKKMHGWEAEISRSFEVSGSNCCPVYMRIVIFGRNCFDWEVSIVMEHDLQNYGSYRMGCFSWLLEHDSYLTNVGIAPETRRRSIIGVDLISWFLLAPCSSVLHREPLTLSTRRSPPCLKCLLATVNGILPSLIR